MHNCHISCGGVLRDAVTYARLGGIDIRESRITVKDILGIIFDLFLTHLWRSADYAYCKKREKI